jgi:hypothetical protein
MIDHIEHTKLQWKNKFLIVASWLQNPQFKLTYGPMPVVFCKVVHSKCRGIFPTVNLQFDGAYAR